MLNSGLFLSSFPCQHFEFIHELVDVLELAIDRGKPDIGDLIDIVQFPHHLFPDGIAGQLRLAHFLYPFFDAIRDRFDRRDADRPFFTGFRNTRQNLQAIERLPAAVFFHDHRQTFFHAFVGRVSAFAGEAFTPAANHLAFLRHTGIDNFVF